MLVAQPWSRMPADGFIIDCIQGASINRAQTWQPPSSLTGSFASTSTKPIPKLHKLKGY
jgi:hypothetical protein